MRSPDVPPANSTRNCAAVFWGKLYRNTPAAGCFTDASISGLNALMPGQLSGSSLLVGAAALRAGCQARSSKPALSHPDCCARKSKSSPAYTWENTTGPSVVCHVSSVPMVGAMPLAGSHLTSAQTRNGSSAVRCGPPLLYRPLGALGLFQKELPSITPTQLVPCPT